MELEQQSKAASLANVWRGDQVENRHCGHVAIADNHGRLLAWAGDPGEITFMRSTAKPIQALPAILHHLPEHVGWGSEELALMTASHRGEPMHIAVLEKMLATSGIAESDLGLSETLMSDEKAREALLRRDGEPRRIYHNCAGKHLGLLALCKQLDWPLSNYMHPEHPLQQEILRQVAAIAGMEESGIGKAKDGCGFPVFSMPIWRIALSYARLAAPPAGWGEESQRAAVQRVTSAMQAAPALVEGTDRLATTLLARQGVLAKSGAQGIFALALSEWKLGIAIKVGDGNETVLPFIVSAILASLADSPLVKDRGQALTELAEAVRAEHPSAVMSDSGVPVGWIEPVVKLAYAEGPRRSGRTSWLA
ncbi:asparaginase [Paenibacillus daejeonensis]|uniref:asparaginase n=1 Tax=Paenibacillus daejeonensis TaxID=135193 RepID=UPI00036F6801|nr:asparaginase [Paenibacillus daejeonensis]